MFWKWGEGLKQRDEIMKFIPIHIIEFRPYAMRTVLWVTFSFGFIITGLCFMALDEGLVSPFFEVIITLSILLLIVHFCVAVYFSSKERATRHQNMQAVATCFYLFKCSLDLYLLYFVVWDVKHLPDFNAAAGITVMLAGFCFLRIMMILRMKGYPIKENYYIDEEIWAPKRGLIYRKVSLKTRFLNYSIYLLIILAAHNISQQLGVFTEGSSLYLLYHAAFLQYIIYMKLSKGLIVTYYKFKRADFTIDDDTYQDLVEEKDIYPNVWWPKLFFIKLVQYLLFFLIGLSTPMVNFEALNVSGIVFFGLFMLLLTKWISVYEISGGMKHLYAVLLGLSCSGIIGMFSIYLTGNDQLDNLRALKLFSLSLFPIIFWYYFDLFSYLRKK